MTRVSLILLFALASLAHAKSLRLATAETSITLEAGATVPHLLSLSGANLHWENRAPESLIAYAWRLKSIAQTADRRTVTLIYESSAPRLRLSWIWQARANHGPLEHTIRIENLGNTAVILPLEDSLRFDLLTPAAERVHQFWIEKGASSPSPEGIHFREMHVGSDSTGTSSTYAHPTFGEPREIIPYLLLQRGEPSESGCYFGIEFSGRTRIHVARNAESISGEIGLNPDPQPYQTRLLPGEVFETPTVFLGTFTGGPDGAGNILRRWLRTTANNPVTLRNPSYPLLVSNSWGSGMAINQQQARHMIKDAAALGLEMFHLDAGWFRGVGDWVPDPTKFPDGIASVADYAHRAGLKFGLWTDWTQAGAHNFRAAPIRDWLTVTPPPDWQPQEFKGITIDISVDAARRHVAEIASNLVAGFHLDMLEHDGYLVAQGCERTDHPHVAPEPASLRRYRDEGWLWVEASNDTDVSYHATRAYYKVQAELRKRFPNLLFEICNDGGRMVDFGSAAHGDYFSITDAYDPLGNRRAFFDASYVFPPAMLETYVEKWPAKTLDNFRYMLRSGMMGWFSLMMDPAAWTPEQREAARAEFALYKSKLRPLIRQADLYHVSARPDGMHWDGIEYYEPLSRHGVLYAFRGAGPDETAHTFKLHGLQRTATYQIICHDHACPPSTATGNQLSETGITVSLPSPLTSELVFFQLANFSQSSIF